LALFVPLRRKKLFYDIFPDHSGLLLDLVGGALALFLLWQKRNAFAGLVKN